MNNTKVMKKVIDLDSQFLATREQSLRVMVQIAIIRKAFGVKNNETNKHVRDYEREIVLSDDDIKKQFNEYMAFWNWAKQKNDMDKAKGFENQIYYFIDGVRFFNANLANEFQQSIIVERVS
ncbi:hypothetical protein PP175_25470 (plasmid) [Aneurinibacillus sp. Ricciae_BoGa-3]|uniref:hypothetical protein n=1 Tax=Aneurinibacillus sp. Ricciae_BoGa-3 TaxID=3022697 RepID=UPI002340C8A4|nr:hypothetical protein [Aneurinibacillus sp. Ricciae_BoGa-3]WCK57420.1 hypothetical protein PP175_25470 [Aneurinibacillus sp. Ricciae_BoGa-3]